jgi:RNA polymerase sigma-70 factor (ECF subfamily)
VRETRAEIHISRGWRHVLDMNPYASCTDAELLRRARRDPEAFVALYFRYGRTAVGWSRRAGIADADVLDAVAELFAEAWRSRRRFQDRGDGSAAAWLHGISRHIAAHYHRRGTIEDAARHRLGMDAHAGTAEPIEPPLEELGDDAALRTALADLPAAQATAVRLRVLDELDYAEIASRLSCTPVTARKHVSNGLLRLRRDLTTKEPS